MTHQFSDYDDATRDDAPLEDATSAEDTEATAASEADDAGGTRKPRTVRSSRRREDTGSGAGASKPRKSNKSNRTGNGSRVTAREENVVHLAHPAADVEDGEAEALRELASRGFSPDEAARIIVLSERLATSRDAREAEASLRRLRFTRWLVERGVLDEFSA